MAITKDIPKVFSHLPTYRGYPVPYFVPRKPDGTFDFKYADWSKIETCIKYDKCCVCFKKLRPKDYWFISGPMGFVNQADSHSPMHKGCAKYSMEICPHLYFERTKRTTDETRANQFQAVQKPNRLFLVGAKKFKKLVIQGSPVIKYSSVFFSDEYRYVNGILELYK